MTPRSLLLIVAGLSIAALDAVLNVRYSQLFPDDVRIWGALSLAALGLGLLLLGAKGLLLQDEEPS